MSTDPIARLDAVVCAFNSELEAERAEHRRTAERWDEERRKWYAERERLIAQIDDRLNRAVGSHFGLLQHARLPGKGET